MIKLLSIVIVLLVARIATADTVTAVKPGGLNVIVAVDESHLSKKVSYTWGMDPFYKTPGFVKGIPKEPSLELKGIFHSEDDSSAIINKRTVYVNSIIDGYAVREIGDNYVVVQKGDTLKELQMPPIMNKVNTEINIYDRLPAMEPNDGSTGEKND
jgi:hypothetical protein